MERPGPAGLRRGRRSAADSGSRGEIRLRRERPKECPSMSSTRSRTTEHFSRGSPKNVTKVSIFFLDDASTNREPRPWNSEERLRHGRRSQPRRCCRPTTARLVKKRSRSAGSSTPRHCPAPFHRRWPSAGEVVELLRHTSSPSSRRADQRRRHRSSYARTPLDDDLFQDGMRPSAELSDPPAFGPRGVAGAAVFASRASGT